MRVLEWLYTDTHASVMSWRANLSVLGCIFVIPLGLLCVSVYRCAGFMVRTVCFVVWLALIVLAVIVQTLFKAGGLKKKGIKELLADSFELWLNN